MTPPLNLDTPTLSARANLTPLRAFQGAVAPAETLMPSDEALQIANRLGVAVPGGKKVIVLTGLDRQVRTDKVSVELARALTLLGEGTILLVDLDVTNPISAAVAELGDNLPEKGFLNALVDPVELSSLIVPTSQPGLSYLGMGTDTRHCQTRLMSEQCPLLLKDLRNDFGWVVVRCAPLSAPESMRIAVHSDGVACILRSGKNTQRDLRHWHESLNAYSVPCLGVIVASGF